MARVRRLQVTGISDSLDGLNLIRSFRLDLDKEES